MPAARARGDENVGQEDIMNVPALYIPIMFTIEDPVAGSTNACVLVT